MHTQSNVSTSSAAAYACRAQNSKAAQKGKADLSKRPAWVQPGKCAGHPWRPLQWDHVSQAQLIAFEAGLRGSHPNSVDSALVQHPCQPCSIVPWQEEGQSNSPPDRQQQLPHALHSIAPDSCVAMHGSSCTTGRAVTSQQVPSRHEHTAQRREAQPCKAAPAQVCQTPPCRDSIVRQTRGPVRCLSAPGQAGAAVTTPAGTFKQGVGRGKKHQADTSASLRKSGRSAGTCKGSPDEVPRPGKARPESAAMCSPQPAARNLDSKHAGSQQLNQRKRSLSAAPKHMSNWVRWEACDEMVGQLVLHTPDLWVLMHMKTALCKCSCMSWKCALRLLKRLLCRRVHTHGQKHVFTVQADLSLHGRSRQAATNTPARVIPQPYAQSGAAAKAVVSDLAPSNSRRHFLPCSSRLPSAPAQQQQDGSGRTIPLQPLFASAQMRSGLSRERERGTEQESGSGLRAGLREARGSESRGARVRYCLSSPEPAVGAGIWEEQTTRCSAFNAQVPTPPQHVCSLMHLQPSTITAARCSHAVLNGVAV